MPKLVLTLRWVVGIGCLAAIAMFLLILTVGKGFDAFRSGPASENLLRSLLPVAIPLLLGAMLASVVLARATAFHHALAVAVVIACLLLAPAVPEHPGEMTIYLGFLGLWLLYYWLLVWQLAGMATFGFVLGIAALPAVLWFGWDYWKATHRAADTNGLTGLIGTMAEGVSGLMLVVSLALVALSGLLIWLGRARR